MATRTSVGTGDWSVAGTWDTGVPVNGDDFIIAAGHTVTFDVDQSGMANGMGASQIAATGQLTIKDDAGTYYLKMNGDLDLDGTLQAGTSSSVPFTGTFTVDFAGAAKSIEVSATGHLYFYCEQPTIKYVVLDEGEPINETVLSCDGYDVTGEPTYWQVGDTICVINSTPHDVEYVQIAATAATSITITGGGGVGGGLDSAVSANSIAVIITRNIRVINVAASDYGITYASGAGIGDYIGAEFSACYRAINGGTGYEASGTCNLLTTSPSFVAATNTSNATFSGNFTGTETGTYAFSGNGTIGCTYSGLFAGWDSAAFTGNINCTLTGRVMGCVYAIYSGQSNSITADGIIDYCTFASYDSSALKMYGTIENCGTGLYYGTAYLASGIIGSNTNYDLREIGSGSFYNTSFLSGTEFYSYDSSRRTTSDYVESFDHDEVVNAYKAWCRGGIVTSQTASPPTGYTIWYEHACEYVAAGSYPCFRQYETTVLPGTAIEVTGKIRIADGEDLSSDPPALQIIDKFADPLVDATQSPLDEDEIPDPDGSETDWQDVSVIWANTGDSPRQVIVRMYASVAGVAANVDVDEVWSIATYQDQIAEIYKKIKRLGPTGES